MNKLILFIFVLPLFLTACSSIDKRGTIAELRNHQIEIKGEEIVDGLDKAMASYQGFLKETPDSALSPEAIRRLADLKVEKEYGFVAGGKSETAENQTLTAPEPAARPEVALTETQPSTDAADIESETDFEQRTTLNQPAPTAATTDSETDQAIDDLEKAGPLEAIILYQKLLDEYPLYQRNDQVLYQMSRAYEELGRIDEAMLVMDRLVQQYPESRYLDEVQFRRAENFFTHRKYLDAEDAYASIVNIGVSSTYYQLALYKLGWTFYKQELYEEAQHKFIALLDYKQSVGYEFEQTEDEIERKRMDDTFRVISLGFSYLGGADLVVNYFSTYGQRAYEDSIYNNLGEYYFAKRRYSDAVATFSAFADRNPFHKKSPQFHMRVIEINTAGGFPSLVIESKKSFAKKYGLLAEYWQHYEPDDRPEIIDYLKTNLTDLANHYHALYQSPKQVDNKPDNLVEALHWYREFLTSFPLDEESPAINYQLADLLLENHSFAEAAVEYEKTAYSYVTHKQSAKAGYAAVYAYRKQLELASEDNKLPIKEEVVRSSLIFADTFPEHEKAAVVLGAAADDLYAMEEYEKALATAQNLIETFPAADVNVTRSAWLVNAHSSYELEFYSEAEAAYTKVLELLPEEDESRSDLFDNLAAAIYRQGEEAKEIEDYATAADHFLRIGIMAPTSGIRPTAEYDAAAALMQLQDWERAATVLTGFRDNFPDNELQAEVTKKIAYVYREDGKLSLAATEYERIESESDDDAVRREALQVAAELHVQANSTEQALKVYRRYVDYFPEPIAINLETRNKMAEIFKKQQRREEYLNELRQIVTIDASAGNERTERTRFLAAESALVLAELSYERFVVIELVKPFAVNLRKKQELMKAATQEFSRLLEYGIGDVTAAATFYLAEIYGHFSNSLMDSERPDDLTPLELEEYELAIEEQAYPFEEKAISVHESNLELIPLGVYNKWIKKSLEKLASFVPVRYAKVEEESAVVVSLETYSYEIEGIVVEERPEEQPAVTGSGQSEVMVPVDEETVKPAAAIDSIQKKDPELD
ncbi:MAG: tetratricopeptide repeat protein [Thermodesulfobacteriota bacterium]|nr:tetratricopeptide repeat protein [Thermodesulfobacteriota bacterium]